MQPDDQPDLFDFLRTVAIAAGRGKLTRVQAAVAVLTALDSTGTTGTGVYVNVGPVTDEHGNVRYSGHAVELGISERQVWRHFHALVKAGWFEQTTKPVKGSGGKGNGVRARYRVLTPPLDLGLAELPSATDQVTPSDGEVSDGQAPERVTPQHERTSHGEVSDRVTATTADMAHGQASEQFPSDSSGTDRLTVLGGPSDIPEREIGTVLPSDGSTSDGSTILGHVANSLEDAREVEGEASPPLPATGHRSCKHTLSGKPYLTKDGTCLHDCGAVDLCYSCVLLSRRGKPVHCYRHTPTKATA